MLLQLFYICRCYLTVFGYVHLFFSGSAVHTQTDYCGCILSWHRNSKFLNKCLWGKFQVASIMFKISSFSWSESTLYFILVFNVVAILWPYSIKTTIYIHKQSEVNTRSNNSCTQNTSNYRNYSKRIIVIIDSIKLILIHIVNYTQGMSFYHAVWNSCVETDDSAAGLWHLFLTRFHGFTSFTYLYYWATLETTLATNFYELSPIS